jgi:hypothetical protein
VEQLVLDDAKIYRTGDFLKAERIKQLFNDAEHILGFWSENFKHCLDNEVRADVKRILLEAREEGLKASHLARLKGYASPANFIGDGSLQDGVNYVG